MKKYKLKEECKKYFTNDFGRIDGHETKEWWREHNVASEALEEVQERIRFASMESEYRPIPNSSRVVIHTNCMWSGDNDAIIEKALNGDLFTAEEVLDFHNKYEVYSDMRECFESAFKQYIKDRK